MKTMRNILIILISLINLVQSFRDVRYNQFTFPSFKSTKLAAAYDNGGLVLFSPCKINLFLRIIKKREDGFHELASLFQAVGFGDTLELNLLGGNVDSDEFRCNMKGVPTDQNNLVIRALNLMREKTGNKKLFFSANLIKECPAQAGLGGGSANAATAMFGANQLMGNPASLQELVEWSAELGSDITFFLSFGTAYCTGRGEIMTPIETPLKAGTNLVIIKPDVGLSTPKVFKNIEYGKLSNINPECLLKEFIKKSRNISSVNETFFINDLELPAFKILPELKKLKDRLQDVKGFEHVMMSGSGTSIFCIGEPDDQEAFDKNFTSRENLKVFFTNFINRPEGMWYEPFIPNDK